MSDSIFLVGGDGSFTKAAGVPFDAEADLQDLLAAHPDLLPGALVDQERPRRWLLVKREAGVPDRDGGGAWWSIDHLFVDQDAVPTFVEVKRASDTRSRREVVAQMLDYAANGSVFWTPGQLRGWFEDGDPEGAAEQLADLLGSPGDEPGTSAEAFWQAVGTNLRDGHIRLIFVADQVPATLQRLVEFLNEQMPRIQVLAVEIRQYRAGGGSRALVSRLIGQTSRAQAAKELPATPERRPVPWTAGEVLESIIKAGADPDPAQAVISWASTHPHIQVTGGTGVSYPSVTMYADSGRSRSRFGVLSLYGSLGRERPFLEIRVKRMCLTPPYDRTETGQHLIAELRALGIPRLGADGLAGKRPNIPLDELADGRAGRLLALVDRWIDDIRSHAGEPEAADESHDQEEGGAG
jgi:hypothetical protein